MRVAMPRNCLSVTRISVPFGTGARESDVYNSEWNYGITVTPYLFQHSAKGCYHNSKRKIGGIRRR
jgi:hypothetical protein